MPAVSSYLALNMEADNGRAMSAVFDGKHLVGTSQQDFASRPVRFAQGLH